MDIDKLKKAYESALTHYNLPDFETFLKDMEDEEKQAKFLESLAKHYSVPDFETFQSDMGLKKKRRFANCFNSWYRFFRSIRVRNPFYIKK